MSSATLVADQAAEPPAPARDTRRELAAELLRGNGVEIGALHLPMVLPAGASVRYVDRTTVPELRKHYPELRGQSLAPVDLVDDGERLETIEPESVDFIVANHFLEHCEDPIRTIETHLRKLRPGGVLFYAVPDKRYTFDFRRPRTPLSHVIADHDDGGQASRGDHYLEWARLVYPEGGEPPEEQAGRKHAAELDEARYSIHFHVWIQADLLEMVLHCQERLGSFDIEAVRRAGLENIVVLRKHGALAVEATRAAEVAAPESAVEAAISPAAAEVPLSALRTALDEGSAQANWSVGPDGLIGRTLLQSAGSVVTIPLRLGERAGFSARVRLLPHDWRDGVGAVRAWVASAEADGRRRTLWSGSLPAAALHGSPGGLQVACELPASIAALKLGVEPSRSGAGPVVARAAWVEPAIVDPSALLAPSPPPAATAPQLRQAVSDKPLISVLTPVHNPPLHMLEEAIASVRGQTFTNWELCLVDDGSTHPEIIAALEHHAATDHRIHLQRRDTAGGISVATNAALELATGEYIALLDHDDTLAPDALQHVANRIAAEPDLDMIYTDEDIIGAAGLIDRHPKPAWSPEHMTALMYTCHLGVYRRGLAVDLGGFQSRFDGCQDYDFVLRLMERTDRIAHVPRILYHWRAHEASTAGGDAKPYAYLAQPAAIAGHLERSGLDASVHFTHLPGIHRIVHRVPPSTSVDLVLAIGDRGDGLQESVASWLVQPHSTWNVVLAGTARALDAAIATLTSAGIPGSRITAVPAGLDVDRSYGLTAAASAATSDHVVFMQTPAAGLTSDWLTRLIGYSNQAGIAAAGPVVLGPDGRIQHSGIAVPDGIPLHLQYGSRPAGAPSVVYNVSAVSGVLATPRDTYQQLGGLNPHFRDLALIEYCLRATDTGQRVVIVPDARLRTTGPDTTTNDLPAIWQLRQSWLATHTHDPYYNPNYRTDRGDFILAG